MVFDWHPCNSHGVQCSLKVSISLWIWDALLSLLQQVWQAMLLPYVWKSIHEMELAHLGSTLSSFPNVYYFAHKNMSFNHPMLTFQYA